MGEKLEGISSALKAATNGGTYAAKEGKGSAGEDDDGAQYQGVGGDLPTKYSSMLSNDAEYINIVKLQLFKLSASPDPLHLVEFSFETSFVVSLKVNAMLGAGISYGNAKQYCFNIDVFSGEKSTDNMQGTFRESIRLRGLTERIPVRRLIAMIPGLRFRMRCVQMAANASGIWTENRFRVTLRCLLMISNYRQCGESTTGRLNRLSLQPAARRVRLRRYVRIAVS